MIVQWDECVCIGNDPNVQAAVRNFVEDSTENNETCMIQEIVKSHLRNQYRNKDGLIIDLTYSDSRAAATYKVGSWVSMLELESSYDADFILDNLFKDMCRQLSRRIKLGR